MSIILINIYLDNNTFFMQFLKFSYQKSELKFAMVANRSSFNRLNDSLPQGWSILTPCLFT